MATRLSANALKELQVRRNQERLAREEQQRLKEGRLASIARSEQSRQNKAHKEWQQQMADIIRAAVGGNLHIDVKSVMWPRRLINAGFTLFEHDIRILEKAVETLEDRGGDIHKEIEKAQSQIIKLLKKSLLIHFSDVARVREIFEQAHDMVVVDDCETFAEALSMVEGKFGLVDLSLAAEQFDRLDQLYADYLANLFEKEELEDQLYSAEKRGTYHDDTLECSTPFLASIECSADTEKIAAKRGAFIRIAWKDGAQETTGDSYFDPDFSVENLLWIAKEGQDFFNHLDEAIGNLPLGIDCYDFELEKNVHGQHLVQGGTNVFFESPNSAQLERCMHALGYMCEVSRRGGEDVHFRLKW